MTPELVRDRKKTYYSVALHEGGNASNDVRGYVHFELQGNLLTSPMVIPLTRAYHQFCSEGFHRSEMIMYLARTFLSFVPEQSQQDVFAYAAKGYTIVLRQGDCKSYSGRDAVLEGILTDNELVAAVGVHLFFVAHTSITSHIPPTITDYQEARNETGFENSWDPITLQGLLNSFKQESIQSDTAG